MTPMRDNSDVNIENRMKLKLSHIILTVLTAFLTLSLSAQDRTVRGTVRDGGGEPLVGASVIVQGTTRGTMTDAAGRFEIAASTRDNLVVCFIG